MVFEHGSSIVLRHHAAPRRRHYLQFGGHGSKLSRFRAHARYLQSLQLLSRLVSACMVQTEHISS